MGWDSVVGTAIRWMGRAGDRIPVGGEVFSTRSDRSWDSSSLLYNEHQVRFPGIKQPGRGLVQPHPSSAEVKESVQL